MIELMANPKVDVRARVEAGLALDTALVIDGYTERQSHEGYRYVLPPVVCVAAGVYSIGSLENRYEQPVFRVGVTRGYICVENIR